MKPIDQQFRPKKDFFVAWFLIAVAMIAFARPWSFDEPWFSKVAWILVVPFIGTFFIYGPVMVVRQVVQSGSHGWLVLRTFLSVVLGIALILVAMHIAGLETSSVGRLVPLVLPAIAIIYLNLRSGTQED